MRIVRGLNEIAHRKSAGCRLSQGRQNTDICGIDEPEGFRNEPVRGGGGRKGERSSIAETQAEPVAMCPELETGILPVLIKEDWPGKFMKSTRKMLATEERMGCSSPISF